MADMNERMDAFDRKKEKMEERMDASDRKKEEMEERMDASDRKKEDMEERIRKLEMKNNYTTPASYANVAARSTQMNPQNPQTNTTHKERPEKTNRLEENRPMEESFQSKCIKIMQKAKCKIGLWPVNSDHLKNCVQGKRPLTDLTEVEMKEIELKAAKDFLVYELKYSN